MLGSNVLIKVLRIAFFGLDFRNYRFVTAPIDEEFKNYGTAICKSFKLLL